MKESEKGFEYFAKSKYSIYPEEYFRIGEIKSNVTEAVEMMEDKMNKSEAYQIVYQDMMSRCGINKGIIDARNTKESFMSGVSCVMEQIAMLAGKEDDYNIRLVANLRESKEAAGVKSLKDELDGWSVARRLIELEKLNGNELPYQFIEKFDLAYADEVIANCTVLEAEKVIDQIGCLEYPIVGDLYKANDGDVCIVLHVDIEDSRVLMYSIEFDYVSDLSFGELMINSEYKKTGRRVILMKDAFETAKRIAGEIDA